MTGLAEIGHAGSQPAFRVPFVKMTFQKGEEMLERLGFPESVVERTCFLIAHHHTYTLEEGMDYHILLEADALVNIYENGLSKAAARDASLTPVS